MFAQVNKCVCRYSLICDLEEKTDITLASLEPAGVEVILSIKIGPNYMKSLQKQTDKLSVNKQTRCSLRDAVDFSLSCC